MLRSIICMVKACKAIFEWVSENDLSSLKDTVLRSSETDFIGYMLEVDLHYPPSLHSDHNQFPCAPEQTKVCT